MSWLLGLRLRLLTCKYGDTRASDTHLLMDLMDWKASSMLPMARKKEKLSMASRVALSLSSSPLKSRSTFCVTRDVSWGGGGRQW